MAVYVAPMVELVVTAGAYTAGDALGAASQFNSVPDHGTIMSVMVIDRADQGINLDMVLFSRSFTGTADNDEFAPSDADLQNCLGGVLVDTWKNFSTNQMGIVDNVGLPYWAPEGILYFQCVTRGTPTYAATDDVRVALGIIY
jgi:hypothetical protein